MAIWAIHTFISSHFGNDLYQHFIVYPKCASNSFLISNVNAIRDEQTASVNRYSLQTLHQLLNCGRTTIVGGELVERQVTAHRLPKPVVRWNPASASPAGCRYIFFEANLPVLDDYLPPTKIRDKRM